MEFVELKQHKFTLIETQLARPVVAPKPAPAPLSKATLEAKRIIHPGMKHSQTLHAYRDLRTAVLPKLERFNSVVMVCAARRGGGGSFTALNLAVSCTFDQHRHALLVDCNFDRPTVASTLEVEAEHGLYDYLSGATEHVHDIIYPTGIPRLSVVPAGSAREEEHLELFTGERMASFLADVKNRFDDRIIILDSPPVLDSSDARILSEVAENILLVLPYKSIGSSKMEKVIKAVGRQKIVGFVMNN